MKTHYWADEVNRITETVFEVTSCLTPSFWDTLSDTRDRSEAADEVRRLAVATEEIAREQDVDWGLTHDYYIFTERLAALYEEAVTGEGGEHGIYGKERKLVRAALDFAVEPVREQEG